MTLPGTDKRIPASPIDSLAALGFKGSVLVPGADAYDATRIVWNAMVDRRPAVIARCLDAADVATAVRFGRSEGLEIGVRCGGHSVLGLGVPDGGLMIDLTSMRSVRVDPVQRLAWVDGGAKLGDLDRAAQAYGLATTAGNVSHTGVGGLTLGGGMGWLARQLGLACDNVAAFTVVTADGTTVRATKDENADLFWGLRGGGGNFGIVTEFEFGLHPTGTTALVADVFFKPRNAREALRGWCDLVSGAPRQATLTAWTGVVGDVPYLPPDVRGHQLVSVGFVWVGDVALGQQFVERLRDLGPAVGERNEVLSYLDLQSIDDGVHGYGMRRYWKGHYLNALEDGAIEAFLALGRDHDDTRRLPSAALQSYGGAISDVAEGESAFSHRDAKFEFVVAARWRDSHEDHDRISAARSYAAGLQEFSTGVYVNALGERGVEETRRAYRAENLDRLATLKGRYDPDNVFHLNHNITPAAS
jgi:FAD/FMN-containing dehydrogenase